MRLGKLPCRASSSLSTPDEASSLAPSPTVEEQPASIKTTSTPKPKPKAAAPRSPIKPRAGPPASVSSAPGKPSDMPPEDPPSINPDWASTCSGVYDLFDGPKAEAVLACLGAKKFNLLEWSLATILDHVTQKATGPALDPKEAV